MATDCRIAGYINPVLVTIGETFDLNILVTDINGDPITLTGFVASALQIYKRFKPFITLSGASAVGTRLIFNDTIPFSLKESKVLESAYNCRCTLTPPGGGPVAVVNFKMLSYFMVTEPLGAANHQVTVRLNALYSNDTGTFVLTDENGNILINDTGSNLTGS